MHLLPTWNPSFWGFPVSVTVLHIYWWPYGFTKCTLLNPSDWEMGEIRSSRPVPHLPLPHHHAIFLSSMDKAQDPIPSSLLLFSSPASSKTVSKMQECSKEHEERARCRKNRVFPTQVLSVACRQDSRASLAYRGAGSLSVTAPASF